MKKMFRLLFTSEISSFISPSIDISEKQSDYEALIEAPNLDYVNRYEKELSQFLGGGHVVTFASGRMSFYSLLKSWGIREGDEVALTGFTCAVMANAVLRTGATPIYVDIDKDTLGMSAESLVSKITNRTKVVVAQHSFGIPCKIDKIKEIAKSHSCYLVEDCALTFGSKYKSIIVGNYGDAAIFSTDHTKPLNTLIGGFVYTNDIDIATSIRAMRDDCGDLSNEHQRMILKTYIDEHRIETVNHKIYIMRNYKKALMNKLHIHNEISPYLELETSAKIAINPYYSYPAKLPSVLAKIGLHVLEQYKANIHQRQSWLKEILQVVEKKKICLQLIMILVVTLFLCVLLIQLISLLLYSHTLMIGFGLKLRLLQQKKIYVTLDIIGEDAQLRKNRKIDYESTGYYRFKTTKYLLRNIKKHIVMAFSNIYKNKKVIITGNTGFKGTWLSTWLKMMGAEVYGYSIGVPTTPSMFDTLHLEDKICQHYGDIRNKREFNDFVQEVKPDFLIHLAAQALVLTSYREPFETMTTNIVGTAVVCEAVMNIDWNCTCVLITSDKAYDNVEWIWGYRETDGIGGKDIYSGSKGAAELVIKSYWHSFIKKMPNIKFGVARAGNVIGGGDWAKDRIIVDCVKAFSEGKTVEIRSPKATRPWQHVLEPLSGYLTLAQYLCEGKCENGESYNFGPRAEQTKTVFELFQDLATLWGLDKNKAAKLTGNVPFEEATLLKLNCDKALAYLHWHSTLHYDECVNFIAEWYRAFYVEQAKDMFALTEKQINAYMEAAKKQNLDWAK